MSYLVGKAGNALLKPAMDFVKENWKYIWNYKLYINKLEDECNYLEHAHEGLKHELEEARDNAWNIEKGVTEWLVEVDKVTKGARVLRENKNLIINPYRRYAIGKEAEEITSTIKELETKRSGFGRIYYRSAPGKVTGSYKGISYHVTPSRDAMLKQINRALMDSDVKVVGVYGPSGVGKSTLLMQVVEQVQSRSLDYDFDEVAVATVSQDPNFEKIQDELAYRLGLKLENEKGVDQKAVRLRQRLDQQDKKILIILDDIWKKLELEPLGIPLHEGQIKLLLTSRKEETLIGAMDCRKNFELKALSKEEAVELFEKILGQQIKSKSILELVGREVEEYACLPVYVVPLAAKLKKHDPSTWRNVLDESRERNKVKMNKLIDEALKNEEVKELFFLCGQIGNQVIATEDLLVYGMGLGLFKGVSTIEECRERLKSLLEILKSFCFLEDYGDGYIKIPDVMSKISLSMASEKQHSLVLRDGKQLQNDFPSTTDLENCESISLPFVGEIPDKLLEELKCPKLNMFLSYNNEDCQIQFPDSFFQQTKELKVLDIFGVSFSRLPSSIEHLHKLHTLCLDNCMIHDLREVGKLKMLQVLTLRGSLFDRLPEEVGELINLRLLDLSRCNELKVIEPHALLKLIKLEELYLPESYEKWEVEGHTNASLDELSGMTCLRCLSICIPDFSIVPHDFPFRNLKRFKILVKPVATMGNPFELGRDKSTRKETRASKDGVQPSKGSRTNCLIEYDQAKTLRLKLDRNDRKVILESWVQTALHKARKLDLMGWVENEKTITELSRDGFSELKEISVQYSPGVKYIFRPKDGFPSSTLESLDLHMLSSLEKIYQGNLSPNSLANLRLLRIKACHKLQTLFSLPLAKGLSRIEEIEVSNCKKLCNIVSLHHEVNHMTSKKGKGGNKLVLKGLRKLVLSNLPEISSFCSKEIKANEKSADNCSLGFFDEGKVSVPLLESLSLFELPNLWSISGGKHPMKLKGLRFLEVKSCKNVSNIVEKGLQLRNLEELIVESCKSVETIFNLEHSTGKASRKDGVPEKLKKLKLVDLESLKSIWHTGIQERYLVCNLNKLKVSGCHKLTHLFSSSMAKSLQSISQISVDDCDNLEMIFVKENDCDYIGNTIRFSSLVDLRISNTKSLTMFAIGDRSFDFPCLKKLEIKQCPMMSTFLGDASSSSIKKCTCSGMSKALVLKARSAMQCSRRNEDDDDRAHRQSFFRTEVTLPSLEKLVLSLLGEFKSIWQTFPSEDSFGKLMSVEIEACSHLHTLLEDERQENGKIMEDSLEKPVLGFPYLTYLKVNGCDELSYLFSDAMARTLFELENLDVSSCQKLSVVVSTEKEEMMMFHKLRSLKLSILPSLRSFSIGQAEHYFPFLKELFISECTQLEAFIKRPLNSSAGVSAMPLFDYKVIIPNLEKLQIQGLELEEIVKNEFREGLFSILKVLEVEKCHKLSTVIPPFILPNFQCLESLTVDSCESVRVIFDFDGHTLRDRRPTTRKSWKLKTIMLNNLPSLKHIYENESFSDYFPFNELNLLNVAGCKSLRSIFTVSTVKILEKLQELSIKGCDSMAQVIKWGPADCSIEGTKKIVFPQLSLLKLSCLPELGSICSKCMTDWPSLKNMEIEHCDGVKAFAADLKSYCEPLFLLEKVVFPKMKSLKISHMSNMTELWNISKEEKDLECSSEAYPKLKTLEISDCNQLSTIFPSKMVQGFRKLEELTIHSCHSVRQVFQLQGLRSEAKSIDNNSSSIPISFSLRKLDLLSLPALDHVWDVENREGIDFSFEELQDTQVDSCHLQYLFPASVVKSLNKLEKISICDCMNLVEIVKRDGSSRGDNFDERDHPQDILFPKSKVTTLILDNLLKMKSFIIGGKSSEWPSLENIMLSGCPEAKIPASRRQKISGDCFDVAPIKEVDILSNLKMFMTDMKGLQELQFVDGFVNVAHLVIQDIGRDAAERFHWKLLKRFHSLEMLTIADSSIEELFPLEGEETDSHAKEGEEIVPYRCNNNRNEENNLQGLTELWLYGIDKLEQVYRGDSIMAKVLDRVRKLKVETCDSLKNLFPTSASFRNLAMIVVKSCDGMEYLLTSSAARCLRQLTVLHVTRCNSMEEIVREDHDENGNRSGANKVDAEICFPRLKELRLCCLDKLKSFSSSSSCSFEFSSLESVSLNFLPELQIFCKGGFTAPLLHDIDVSEDESIDEHNRLKGKMEFDD